MIQQIICISILFSQIYFFSLPFSETEFFLNERKTTVTYFASINDSFDRQESCCLLLGKNQHSNTCKWMDYSLCTCKFYQTDLA